jgi:hypothetical protein
LGIDGGKNWRSKYGCVFKCAKYLVNKPLQPAKPCCEEDSRGGTGTVQAEIIEM